MKFRKLKRLFITREHHPASAEILKYRGYKHIILHNIEQYDSLMSAGGILGDSLWDDFLNNQRCLEHCLKHIEELKNNYKYNTEVSKRHRIRFY